MRFICSITDKLLRPFHLFNYVLCFISMIDIDDLILLLMIEIHFNY